MTWADPRCDVGFARRRALALLDERGLYCVWTGRKLTADRLDIDHRLPWAAWPCEDLWNLMPSSPAVNQHGKRDKLPTSDLLERSEDRIMSLWDKAWVANLGTVERFMSEAWASLPVPTGRDDLVAMIWSRFSRVSGHGGSRSGLISKLRNVRQHDCHAQRAMVLGMR